MAGQAGVDQALELTGRDARVPVPAVVRGEPVAPAAELAERFADTMVAQPQT